jgi:hypothetical protein
MGQFFHGTQYRPAIARADGESRGKYGRTPAVQTLQRLAAEHGKVTLLFVARDPGPNHARALQEFLEHRSSSGK